MVAFDRLKGLKVHKNENFFGFDFEFCTISLLVMSKYKDFAKKIFLIWPVLDEVRFFRVVLGLRGMKKNFELGQKKIFLFFFL
jgi:hypothetical protein